MSDIEASLQDSSNDRAGAVDDDDLCLEFEGLMKEIEKQDKEEKERAKSAVGQKWGMRTSLPSIVQPPPVQTGSGRDSDKDGVKVESKLRLPLGGRSSTPTGRKTGVEVSPMRRASASDMYTPDNYGCAVGRIPFANKPCANIDENRNNRVPFSDDGNRRRGDVAYSNPNYSSDRSLSPLRKQEKYTPAVLTPRRDSVPARKPLPTPVLPDRYKKNTPKKEVPTF